MYADIWERLEFELLGMKMSIFVQNLSCIPETLPCSLLGESSAGSKFFESG